MPMREGKRTLGEIEVKLRDFLESKKRMPSYAELGGLLALRSQNAVAQLVAKLEDANVVNQDATGRLAKGSLFDGVAVLGLVEAGFPTGAEETFAERMSLDDFLIDKKEASYLLTVKGDSMIGAGIHEGDLVLVERGAEAKTGGIVIAGIDGAFSMKYF